MESEITEGRLRLNLGCGGNSTYTFHDFDCDVRVDILPPLTKIENFILCDVNFLPFRDKIFTYVISSHLIEHLDHPEKSLKEIRRVCSRTIHLFYPHYFSPFAYLDPNHKWIIMGEKFVFYPKMFHSKFFLPLFTRIRDVTQRMTRFRISFLEKEKIISVK